MRNAHPTKTGTWVEEFRFLLTWISKGSKIAGNELVQLSRENNIDFMTTTTEGVSDDIR